MASPQLTDRAAQLRSALRFQDPGLVAARSGSSYLMMGPGRGELYVPLFESDCILSWPDLMARNPQDDYLSDMQQVLLLYYLATADGRPLTGTWVSFAELPDGRMYSAAFQGYSGDEIVKAFDPMRGHDIPPKQVDDQFHEFKQACLSCGGKSIEIGLASFTFQALPRVPLMVTYWPGDEDFPSSCKILFDETACHYLPIDVCAILGSMLTHKLTAIR